jgi:hypothetical protein
MLKMKDNDSMINHLLYEEGLFLHGRSTGSERNPSCGPSPVPTKLSSFLLLFIGQSRFGVRVCCCRHFVAYSFGDGHCVQGDSYQQLPQQLHIFLGSDGIDWSVAREWMGSAENLVVCEVCLFWSELQVRLHFRI